MGITWVFPPKILSPHKTSQLLVRAGHYIRNKPQYDDHYNIHSQNIRRPFDLAPRMKSSYFRSSYATLWTKISTARHYTVAYLVPTETLTYNPQRSSNNTDKIMSTISSPTLYPPQGIKEYWIQMYAQLQMYIFKRHRCVDLKVTWQDSWFPAHTTHTHKRDTKHYGNPRTLIYDEKAPLKN